jgi:hypothetical protein
MARPLSTSYTDEERQGITDHVLAELSAGAPISRTLGADREEWLCSERCFWNWYYAADADDKNGLVQKVARARDNGVEAMVDKAIHVAETPQLGEIVTVERDPDHQKDLDNGEEVSNQDGSPYEGMIVKVRKEDMLGHRKLVVDTLLKAAQMLKPKKYGPRQLLGSDPDNPLPVGFQVVFERPDAEASEG